MGLSALNQTAEKVCQAGITLSAADKEYVVQFAFRTGDGELTNKLIDELIQPGIDKAAVYRRFNTMIDFQPDWVQSIENLLVSLEMYRMQEEKTLKALEEILSAYGIELTKKEIKEFSMEKLRNYMEKTELMQR